MTGKVAFIRRGILTMKYLHTVKHLLKLSVNVWIEMSIVDTLNGSYFIRERMTRKADLVFLINYEKHVNSVNA